MANKKKTQIVHLTCPKCKEKFADMKFAYGTKINPEDIEILKGAKKAFAQDEDLCCTCCGYVYLSWDIYLAIAEAAKNEK